MRLKALFSILFLSFFCCLYGEISITPPKGWECITDTSQLPQKILKLYVGGSKSKFTPSINIASEESAATIEDYVRAAKMYHESQPNVKCTLMGKVDSKSGLPLHLMQIDTSTQMGNVRFIQAITIKNKVAYVITATCLQEEFSHLSSQFFKAIQTFSIQ